MQHENNSRRAAEGDNLYTTHTHTHQRSTYSRITAKIACVFIETSGERFNTHISTHFVVVVSRRRG